MQFEAKKNIQSKQQKHSLTLHLTGFIISKPIFCAHILPIIIL